MGRTKIRRAQPRDAERLAQLREKLWPESSAQEHKQELEEILAGKFPSVLPLAVLVAEDASDRLLGFVEVGLRSYADGCDARRPVGYVEGWYVSRGCRRQGIGAKLLRAAEDWARRKGCKEIASDAAMENKLSQAVHKSLGFEVVERSVLFRKPLHQKRGRRSVATAKPRRKRRP